MSIFVAHARFMRRKKSVAEARPVELVYFMRWIFRPSVLILVSLALVLGAAVLVLLPMWEDNRAIKPIPLGVSDDEREIVWLYAATSATPWERFVAGAGQAVKRLNEDSAGGRIEIDDSGAFPRETATTPQFAIKLDGRGRLLFRWYKLTSNSKTSQWVEALLHRRPPPLAIIGGSSSDLAIDLAKSLREQTDKFPEIAPPIILLTAATADRTLTNEGLDAQYINQIHAGRTFRFCFTNRQMADAITGFIWERDELRPDPGPIYVSMWKDDAYSLDLTDRFFEALKNHAPSDPGSFENLPIPEFVDYSVGGFDQPNRWEEPVVRQLMDTKLSGPNADQMRPLLFLPGASSQPMRRFLRGLMRTAPDEARKFVVATGDALSFNTVYRDREVLWPIQDLPFNLVHFCHRNPVESEAGFRAEEEVAGGNPNRGSPATGTEDLLLNRDIVEALALIAKDAADLPANGDALAQRFQQARWDQGRIALHGDYPLLFDEKGNRSSGTGEHVVWIRPSINASRVDPKARIEVFTPDKKEGKGWQLVGNPLEVGYELSKSGK
ncbi:MAG: hypothetical protein ACJ8FY_13245 [Gemmataceae bacterium]